MELPYASKNIVEQNNTKVRMWECRIIAETRSQKCKSNIQGECYEVAIKYLVRT